MKSNERNISVSILPEGHKKLKSRRDFLSHSVGAFAAAAMVPSVWSLLMGRASAALGADTIPFLVFDLAGGAGLPGSFLVGKDDRGNIGLLGSYSRLGWDPRKARIDNQFGLPMNATSSQIFSQLVATASVEARSKLRMGSFCHFAQDDSPLNPLSAVQLVHRASSPATYLQRIIGTGTGVSGGRSRCVDETSEAKSLNISSFSEFVDSVGYGRTFEGLPEGLGTDVVQGLLGLSRSQLKDLQKFSNGNELTRLAEPSYAAMLLQSDLKIFDPRYDDATKSVYQLNQKTPVNQANLINATIAMNTLKGHSSASVLTIGGCDYHTGSSTEGDRVDGIIGTEIGRVVELAYRLKKKFFFQILTDGGVSASEGSRNWSSDDGTKSMSVIGFFNPDAAPTQRRLQVGAYTDGQGADFKTFLGTKPDEAAHAVFANYLSVSGRVADFSKYVATSSISSGNIDSILIF